MPLSFVFFLIPTCLCAPSCLPLCDPPDCSPSGSSVRGIFPGKITDVGCHLLLQGIFPTQGWNQRPFIFLRGPHSRGINQNSGLSLLSTLRLALLCLHGTGCGQGNVSSSDAGSLLGAPLEPVCELSTRSHHSYQSPQSRGGATCSTRGHGFREDGSPRDMGLVTGCTLLSDTVLALLPAPKRSSWVAASIDAIGN